MSGFRHQACLYEGADGFVESLLPFVRAGLGSGDRVLAVTSPANADALREALGAGADAVDVRDAAEWYRTPGAAFGGYADYALDTDGGRGVRVVGEPVWPTGSDAAVAEWARYESALNVAFAGSPVWIVCPYDTAALPESILEHARDTHPELHDAGGCRASPSYREPAELWRRLDAAPLPPARGEPLPLTGDLGRVRARVAEAATAAGLPRARVHELVLAAHEVATNALRHGGGDASLRAWREDGRLVCEVADSGPGIAQPAPGYVLPDPERTGGRGLVLARRLCDLVEIRSGADGTVVRLHVSLQA